MTPPDTAAIRGTGNIEIRILGRGDTGVLGRVAPDVFDDAVDPALVAEFLSDARHHIAVAIENGIVVGFASGVHYVHPDKSAEFWVNEVGVAPDHQGRGVGKAIMTRLLDHATQLGCREAWVLTDRSNDAAMRLYASSGGVEGPRDEVMFTFVLTRRRI